MSTIFIETRIRAPIELSFDLARDVNAHAESAAFSAERVVEPGRTQGYLKSATLSPSKAATLVSRSDSSPGSRRSIGHSGSSMKWSMARFKRLRHVHEFEFTDGATIMRDTIEWEAPLGVLGRLADLLLLRRHMRWFVATKQNDLKRIAEDRAHSAAN